MIKVEHLTKYYGETLAVNDLSFEIGEGKVYGFLGPNGAGKSTTMNIITGCLSPTAGKVLVGGHDILEEPLEARRMIGYLPEHPPLYLSETPLEYLRFVGEAKGLRGEALKKEINKVIEETGIESVENRLISSLSKGFRQRVGIAQALIGNPGIIILDEPTVGLDPIQIIEIRSLIKQLGETHTVIFSSHILSEVQALCSEILIIANGELVAFDTPENLEKAAAEKSSVLLTVLAGQEETEKTLQASAENSPFSWTVLGAENGEVSVRISAENEDARSLLSRLFFDFAEAGLPIIGMTAEKAGLEEVFVELTEEKEAE